jgi:hypothetical protein
VFRDGLSDLSTNALSTSVAELEAIVSDLPANHMSDIQQPANLNSQQQQEQQQLNLMTPDAFSSPAKKDSPTDVRSPQVSNALVSELCGLTVNGTHKVTYTNHPKICAVQIQILYVLCVFML